MGAELTPEERARQLVQRAVGDIAVRRPVAPRPTSVVPAANDQLDRSASGYRTRYPTRRAPSQSKGSDAPRLLMAVSTFNRRNYVERFIETFAATRNTQYEWTLVVADDGSTDSTLEYLRDLDLDDCRVLVIENKNRSIAGQTNSILAVTLLLDPDLAFKADDDIYFAAPGWDDLYLETVRESGFGHLIYHNTDWKPRHHTMTRGGLESFVPVTEAMGCFYTLTPQIIEEIGYLDEVNFRLRGHGHLDWSTRACRIDANEADTAWDAAGSAEFIKMWPRDDYVDLTDWNSPQVQSVLSEDERNRRMELIRQEDRVFVEHRVPDAATRMPRAHMKPPNDELWQLLSVHSVAQRAPVEPILLDSVAVLNMEADVAKWAVTAGMLARNGLNFERFPAVDGGTEDNVEEWRAYESEGLVLDLEKQLNRRLIQSTGAWGYLKSMRRLLTLAVENRHEWILVFDDDIMVHAELRKLLDERLAGLPRPAALLYLGNSQLDLSVVRPVDDVFYHPGGEANGSFAVLYHSSAFESLLASIDRFEAPFDAGPMREIDHQRPREVFALWEPLVIADVSTSSIRKPRDMDEFAARFDWNLDLYEQRRGDGTFDPAISIIVVGTDMEHTISLTLEALRWQTMPNIEILVGDNGSQDNTAAVLRELRRRDSRVRAFRVEQQVTDAALANRLLAHAAGTWISLVPPEANLPRDHFDQMLATVEEQAADAIATRAVTGPVPARLEPQLDASKAHRSLTGGLVRKHTAEALGGFVAIDETGQTELLERIRAHFSNRGLDFTIGRNSASTIWLPALERSPFRREYQTFHAEIAKGQRSARIPSAATTEITELG